MVSQEGIVPAQASPKGDAGVSEFFVAKPLRAKREVVSRVFASWNQIREWLRHVECIRLAA